MEEFVGDSVIDTTLFPDTKNFPHDARHIMDAATNTVTATFTLRTNCPFCSAKL